MFLLLAGALIGGLITLTVLWPSGALIALAGAPFGGSLSAAIAGLLLAWLRAKAERESRRSVEASLVDLKAQRGSSSHDMGYPKESLAQRGG